MDELSKYITQIRGISYKPSEISSVPLFDYLPILKANNITEDGLDTSDLIFIHKSKIKKEQLIKKGDLLLAASSGSKEIVGKNVFFEADFNGSFGAFCKVVRPTESINPKFLAAFFKTENYKRHIKKLIQGANINNLKNEHIDSLKIPTFSPIQQGQIADVLFDANSLIKQRKESIELLDKFLESIFFEMFGDPVNNQMKWEKDKIGRRCKVTKLAGYEYTKYIKYLEEGEIIVVKGLNVKNGKLKLDNISFIDKATSDLLIRSKLFKGDVVMTYIGINIGDVAIIEDDNKYHLAPNVSKITPNNFNDINSYYLLHYLMYNNWLFTRGTTDTAKPSLNMGEIRDIFITIPSIELQKKFEAIVKKADMVKEFYNESLIELENLFGSLNQLAFKGELEFKNISQKEIGDPFDGVEIPEGKLSSIDDLDKTKWKDKPAPSKEEASTTESKSTYEALFPIMGKIKGKAPDLRDVELLIQKHFKDGYFVFEDLRKVFINMGFEYDFELLKNFVFELLRKGKLRQVFADAAFKSSFKESDADYIKIKELNEQMYLQQAAIF